MSDRANRELECLKQGIFNDLTLRRITRKLIEQYGLPDGKYVVDEKWTRSMVAASDNLFQLSMELVLPSSSPIRYGTAVISGDVRLFIQIESYSPTAWMDLEVDYVYGPFMGEEGGELCYRFEMRLSDDRAGVGAASA